MSGGNSGKFLQREFKIQFSRNNLGEQKVLESAFFRLSKSLKPKILANMVPLLEYTIALLQASCFELLEAWNIYETHLIFTPPSRIISGVKWDIIKFPIS